MRHLSPAGTPIRLKDLLFWSKTVLSPKRAEELFSRSLRKHLGMKHSSLFSTGRAAMVVLLKTLKDEADSDRDVVIIPSYTCYSVPASIIKAGLRVRVCDITPKTLDYNYEQLENIDFSDVLCIVSSNLYGLPNRMKQLSEIAVRNRVYLVDDAAQSLGASVDGQLSGTFGDAGLLSLDKGKVITSMNGGIIVTNHPKLSIRLKKSIQNLQNPSMLWSMKEVLKLCAYSFFLDPRRYWLPAKLPFLNLGGTIYTTEYPIEKYNGLLSGIALRLFSRIEEDKEIRIENANYYRRKLIDYPHVDFIEEQKESSPIYLRFPLLAKNIEIKNRILKELDSLGLGASGSYPNAVPDIAQLSSIFADDRSQFPGGRAVAARIITLPTHPYVTNQDMDNIVRTIEGI